MGNTSLIHQILTNCDISDARHAGLYSICGLALRFRDLYKWARGLEPWQEGDSSHVLAWIGEKEALWETLTDSDYRPLNIGRHTFDPFDTRGINRMLSADGLFYGAGYAYSLKPTFFLARVVSHECIDARVVWCLDREYARDLVTMPAFCQDGEVVLRMEAARMFLWDQMIYVDHSARAALQFALQACCGVSSVCAGALRPCLDDIWQVQKLLYVRHEIGELADTAFDRRIWRQMVADYAHTPVELLVRALKDMLADTDPQGTLPDLIGRRDAAALGFYRAFCPGMTLTIFHEFKTAFADFGQRQDWTAISQCVRHVREKALAYTGQVLEIQRADPQRLDPAGTRRAIEETMRQRGVITSSAPDQES